VVQSNHLEPMLRMQSLAIKSLEHWPETQPFNQQSPFTQESPFTQDSMTKKTKIKRPKARLPKGFRDIRGPEIRAMQDMIASIRKVYEIYGFEALETPAFEYTDALGKFLPDQERPNAGVFSIEDEDTQWMSLRYDLTAPLARFVAQNYDALPKPYRRYQTGTVFRNEKPGPGRFRQFTQFDADTVGAPAGAPDAEMCMMMADIMEAVGIKRGDYVIRVNNRKILDGLMETLGLGGDDQAAKRINVLRSLDKMDKFPRDQIALLLGKEGRKDESGDFTKGAGLDDEQIKALFDFLDTGEAKDQLPLLDEGLSELSVMEDLVRAAGYEEDRIKMDPSVVRGLEYYTGPVFEAEVTFDVTNDKGQVVQFGAVGGGGRYDGLVARFKGVEIPATGMSIGVSRLYTAMQMLNTSSQIETGPVLVLVMDREYLSTYQAMAQELRASGIAAEMYLGTSGMRAQMKYADKRGAPCVIIQGEDERDSGEITIKDLKEGARLSSEIEDNKEWREGRPAQFSVAREELVKSVAKLIEDQAKNERAE